MGLDLRLLPIDFLSDNWGYSHTVLDLPRSAAYAVRDGLNNNSARPMGKMKIASFAARPKNYPDLGYADLQEKDAYGDPYTYVAAADLLPILEKAIPGHPATVFVKAMIGRKMQPTDLIILDWH